jgi:hypothetical protein
MDVLGKKQLLQTLLNEALTMAKTHGFLWTLVLDRIMMQLKRKDYDVDQGVMLTNLQDALSVGESSFMESVEKSESVVQSIVTVVSYVADIYNVKVLTEQNIKLMDQKLGAQGRALMFIY